MNDGPNSAIQDLAVCFLPVEPKEFAYDDV